jgi:cytoskeleton-associated protein 5
VPSFLSFSYPSLRDVDYGDVQRELRCIITKDANVQCVAEAIGCCGALAKSVRSGYANSAKVRTGGGVRREREGERKCV